MSCEELERSICIRGFEISKADVDTKALDVEVRLLSLGTEGLSPCREARYYCMIACQRMLEMLDTYADHGSDSRNSVREWLRTRYC